MPGGSPEQGVVVGERHRRRPGLPQRRRGTFGKLLGGGPRAAILTRGALEVGVSPTHQDDLSGGRADDGGGESRAGVAHAEHARHGDDLEVGGRHEQGVVAGGIELLAAGRVDDGCCRVPRLSLDGGESLGQGSSVGVPVSPLDGGCVNDAVLLSGSGLLGGSGGLLRVFRPICRDGIGTRWEVPRGTPCVLGGQLIRDGHRMCAGSGS